MAYSTTGTSKSHATLPSLESPLFPYEHRDTNKFHIDLVGLEINQNILQTYRTYFCIRRRIEACRFNTSTECNVCLRASILNLGAYWCSYGKGPSGDSNRAWYFEVPIVWSDAYNLVSDYIIRLEYHSELLVVIVYLKYSLKLHHTSPWRFPPNLLCKPPHSCSYKVDRILRCLWRPKHKYPAEAWMVFESLGRPPGGHLASQRPPETAASLLRYHG